MYTLTRAFIVWNVVSIAATVWSTAQAATLPSPGFLVIAPDRGYLGNKEIKTVAQCTLIF